LVSPAHLEANLQAFAKAMGTWLRLQEVYGIAEQVRAEADSAVDVFRALLATELMTAFYIEDFLRPYHQHLQQLGHPWLALGRLAFGGLLQSDMQNRFPITWSDREAKIARITLDGHGGAPPRPGASGGSHPGFLDQRLECWPSVCARVMPPCTLAGRNAPC
jgi:hypothetical protein